MAEIEYYNLMAWIDKKKIKVGYAYFDPKTGQIRLKPDTHLDSAKLGRALLKGEVLIEQR